MKDNLKDLIFRLRQLVPSATGGLPLEFFYFVSSVTPMINVDLVIKNPSGQCLLTWREDQFYGPAWHIPGGIIRFKETIEQRVQKVAYTELGCHVRFNKDPIKISEKMNNTRDVRGHFISILFLCELIDAPDPLRRANASDPKNGEWMWHDRVPQNFLSVQESFRELINDTVPL